MSCNYIASLVAIRRDWVAISLLNYRYSYFHMSGLQAYLTDLYTLFIMLFDIFNNLEASRPPSEKKVGRPRLVIDITVTSYIIHSHK